MLSECAVDGVQKSCDNFSKTGAPTVFATFLELAVMVSIKMTI